MSHEDCAIPEPSAEHAKLMENVGRWNVSCTYFMDPTQPAMKLEAVETIEALGPFWTVSLFEADFMGAPFMGRCQMGYDVRREKHVATWVDSMSPHMFLMDGRYDDSGKVLTMTCEGPMPGSDQMTTYRSVYTANDDGTRGFDMFMATPDGGEAPMFTYTYSRAE